ncbi:MAG TPA: hypothetical protein HA306_08095 [Methanosarcina sp.]|nr:hypothetical protein [Methanosarcina sp.]
MSRVTAPATEVTGIYGFSTNVMPPRAIVSWLRCSPFQILHIGLPCTTSYGYGLYPSNKLNGISPAFILKSVDHAGIIRQARQSPK